MTAALEALGPLAAAGEVAVIGLGRSGTAVAELLTAAGARVYASDSAVGAGHDLERIAHAATVVVSPGVPPDAPPLAAARSAGVPVLSEIEVALRAMPGVPYIAVTGTNGKTTVTALIAHLLRALGLVAVEAGNIGTPLSAIALAPRRPAWMAIELSSYQLHDTPSVAPVVAVLTNLAPDHLDRYPSLDAYYADKDLIFRNAIETSIRVVNADDAEVLRRTAAVPGIARTFGIAAAGADARYDAAAALLMLDGSPLLERPLLPLLGAHNVANALAATLAVWQAVPTERTTAGRARLAVGLRSFRALPHRLEPIGERDGVLWVNDSKATNIGAARVGILAMERPTVLLLGGRHKGEPYTGLLDAMRDRVTHVLAYGEAEPRIAADLKGHVAVERCGSSFPEVITRARSLARAGDAVLLSPACSSFDMFTDYEERGAVFRQLALGT
ncbi:MAG: UDP-N-acetylmuramoyl-L-alanine--D-glutamate ligase [Gemmatimonadaceae bacterium]